MSKEKNYGCLGLIICFIISFAVLGSLSNYIGELAFPLIVVGGFGLFKLTESLWSKKN